MSDPMEAGTMGEPAFSPDRVKHLELIQAVVARVAGNSFLVKGWCITLVAAMVALAAKDADRTFVGVVYFPILLFCALDAFYLRQERLFRCLYDEVRKPNSTIEPFSMDSSRVTCARARWGSVIFSLPVLGFYLALLLSVSAVMLLPQ